jgi:hypothetical protein
MLLFNVNDYVESLSTRKLCFVRKFSTEDKHPDGTITKQMHVFICNPNILTASVEFQLSRYLTNRPDEGNKQS